MTRTLPRLLRFAACVLLALMILPFALYALVTGLSGLLPDDAPRGRFFTPGAPLLNGAVFAHMMAGGLLSVLIIVQLVQGIRLRWPLVHRLTGRLLIAAALITGAGGLMYIAGRGTIGGPPMNAGFALYGGLMILAAIEALRHARAQRFDRHRRWALRLFVLAIGSWLYRVHYGIWDMLGYEAGLATDFRSPFDLVQNVAFYLPYLILLELWMRRRPATVQRAISTQTRR
ncbi:DUF2306 domain-containing protein [Roseobacter sp.]|uniref:DUF2306 domain-containing protein n=1 Tax=Roseobacter sp. TaxID=1907202 RepID=UPI0025FCB8F4|nr:DUF2306 domain-containing protein [Roseobacter sp.]